MWHFKWLCTVTGGVTAHVAFQIAVHSERDVTVHVAFQMAVHSERDVIVHVAF